MRRREGGGVDEKAQGRKGDGVRGKGEGVGEM